MKVFGFAGYSGAGKTTLIEKLLPRFVASGRRVSLIKHTHHHFDLDQPGKDSWRHRQAGATEVMLVCEGRWALLHELRGAPMPSFEDQLARLADADLVLVEGFRVTPIPKLEVHRAGNGKPWIHPENPDVVAVALPAADPVPDGFALPRLDLDDDATIADWILHHVDGLPDWRRRND